MSLPAKTIETGKILARSCGISRPLHRDFDSPNIPWKYCVLLCIRYQDKNTLRSIYSVAIIYNLRSATRHIRRLATNTASRRDFLADAPFGKGKRFAGN